MQQSPKGPRKLSSLETLKITGMCHETIKKWLPYQILSDKTVKNVQIDQQTTEYQLSPKNTGM